jgi:hypothetical protein
MARTPSEEIQPGVNEARVNEVEEWSEMVLKINTEIKSRKFRRQFTKVVQEVRETKHQVCAFDLDDLMARATESMQNAQLLKEKKKLEEEVSPMDLRPCVG